jgi:hypothetical protein
MPAFTRGREESGIRDRLPDTRDWLFETMEAARKLYDRRIGSKTIPQRKSPRK